jgi:hypothetical protein
MAGTMANYEDLTSSLESLDYYEEGKEHFNDQN